MNSTLNIAMVTSSFLPRIGGFEIVIHNVAEALTTLGHNVTVFARRIKGANSIGRAHSYQIIRYGTVMEGGTKTGYNHIHLLIKLLGIRRKHGIDVIHCHTVSYSGCYVRFANKFLNLPVVATPQGEDIQKLPDIKYGIRLKKGWEKKIIKNLNSFTLVTSISQSIDEDLKELLSPRDYEEKVVSIPNGVSLDSFSICVNADEIRQKYDIPVDSKIIISVGRNHPKKGFKYVVEAMPSIVNSVPNAYYLIVGRDTEELGNLAANLGVERRLILVGQISDREELIKLYKSADVYISPSLIEGFSLTNVEALASGLPLIVTDVPGNRDVHSKEHSLLMEPASPDSIAKSCIKILQNDSMRIEMAKSALVNAQKYDWTQIAKRYIDSYLKAIQMKH